MTMCAQCAVIVTHVRGTAGHSELAKTSELNVSGRRGPARIDFYRCQVCGSRWCYEDDGQLNDAGWSML